MSKQTLTFRNTFTVMVKAREAVDQIYIRATPPLLRDVTRDNMAAKYEGLKSTPLNKKHR